MRLSSIVFGACIRMLRLPPSVSFRGIDVFLEETEPSILILCFLFTLSCGVCSIYVVNFGLGEVGE